MARKKPLIKVFNGSQLGDASANTELPEGYIAFDKDAVLEAIREAAKDVSGDRPLLEGLLLVAIRFARNATGYSGTKGKTYSSAGADNEGASRFGLQYYIL